MKCSDVYKIYLIIQTGEINVLKYEFNVQNLGFSFNLKTSTYNHLWHTFMPDQVIDITHFTIGNLTNERHLIAF